MQLSRKRYFYLSPEGGVIVKVPIMYFDRYIYVCLESETSPFLDTPCL